MIRVRLIILLSVLIVPQMLLASNDNRDLRKLDRLMSGEEHVDVPNKCGLPGISLALSQRVALDGETEAALQRVLTRPATQTSIVAGHFRIHFDTTGFHEAALLNENQIRIPNSARAFADSAGRILQYALRLLRDSLGYLPPPADNGAGGGQEYDIYVQNLGGASYGYTTPETPINNKPEGGTFTSFIVIDNDFDFVSPPQNRGLPALRVTLAHELFHAVQLGNYGYWVSDIYFYEMTAVWVEDVAYTDVNDYHQYVRSSSGHFARPEVSFTSNSLIMYSRAVWPHYLAKRFGRNVIRRVWQEMRIYRPVPATDAALQAPEFSSNFRSAIAEWSIWNYFTADRADSIAYYPEGRNYPRITETAVDFSPPSRMVGGSLTPLSSRYYDVNVSDQHIKLLVLNLNVTEAQGDNTRQFTYVVQLNAKRVDGDFIALGQSLFAKLDVADPTNWYMKDLLGSSSVDVPFPNPFTADGRRLMHFPLLDGEPVAGTLRIYSSSMDLVFEQSVTSLFLPQLGKQVMQWRGVNDNGQVVGSGIYLYILRTPQRTYKGKFAVVRR